jgi:hypothetical protein
MNRIVLTTMCLLLAIAPRYASAHGTPIVVTAASAALSASGGLADSIGFAPQIFVEDDEDGDSIGNHSLPGVGPVVLWNLPGLNISGLDNAASLSIEVLARPVKDSNPLEHRVVWYWSPQQEEVAPTVADVHLLGTGARFTTLSAASSEPPPPFLLASTLTGQENSHNHGLLSYGLDNDVTRPAGAYGFFARLTSNQYAASNPFLIVLNHGVDYELMVQAALAINAAAAESDSLPGDFNLDGSVDAADYVMWRKPTLVDDEYETWQTNFGRTNSGGGGYESYAVPEPSTVALVMWVIALAPRRFYSRGR